MSRANERATGSLPCFAALVLGLLGFLVPFAGAQDRAAAPSPTIATQSGGDSEYDALVKRALAEYERGNWTEAKAFFLRAHQLRPSARTLRGIGLAAYELRSYVEALVYLRQALANHERPLTEEMRAEITSTLEDAKSFVAHEMLHLVPRQARARVDGQPAVFDDDGSLLLDPGTHELRLECEGFEGQKHSLEVKGGEHAELRLVLRPLATESANLPPRESGSGSARSGELPYFESLTTQHKVGLGLGVAGLAGLGVGAVFSVLALDANSASKDECDGDICSEKGLSQRNSALARADGATVAFVAGGALLGASAVLYLTAPARRRSDAAFNVTPWVEPGLALITTRGSW